MLSGFRSNSRCGRFVVGGVLLQLLLFFTVQIGNAGKEGIGLRETLHAIIGAVAGGANELCFLVGRTLGSTALLVEVAQLLLITALRANNELLLDGGACISHD